MKITVKALTGFDSGDTGYKITRRSIMGITFAGFVVIGYTKTKLRSTTSYPGHQRTSLTPIIFNRPMGFVTIEKAHSAGNR